MKKKYQVFISSTYLDLIEERQAVVEAILETDNIPAGMELFKAGKSQISTINRWIEESDIFILLLGGRYGSINKEEGKSYIHLEYEFAFSKNMPILTIILKEDMITNKLNNLNSITKIDNIIERENIKEYTAFKDMVQCNLVEYVSSIQEIKSAIFKNLPSIINENVLKGWQKVNNNTYECQRAYYITGRFANHSARGTRDEVKGELKKNLLYFDSKNHVTSELFGTDITGTTSYILVINGYYGMDIPIENIRTIFTNLSFIDVRGIEINEHYFNFNYV